MITVDFVCTFNTVFTTITINAPNFLSKNQVSKMNSWLTNSFIFKAARVPSWRIDEEGVCVRWEGHGWRGSEEDDVHSVVGQLGRRARKPLQRARWTAKKNLLVLMLLSFAVAF